MCCFVVSLLLWLYVFCIGMLVVFRSIFVGVLLLGLSIVILEVGMLVVVMLVSFSVWVFV